MEAFRAKIAAFDQQRREAQERNASADELNAITSARNREQTNQPSSPFAARILLHNVVRIGNDYIEIEATEKPNSSTLIPFTKICRVIITKPGNVDSEQDDARE